MNIMEVVKRSGESQKISFDKILNRIDIQNTDNWISFIKSPSSIDFNLDYDLISRFTFSFLYAGYSFKI